jgi:hypothetical protein
MKISCGRVNGQRSNYFSGSITILGLFLSFLFASLITQAAEPEQPLSMMDPVKAGQLLAERLRASAPTEPSALKGTIKIRRRGAATLEVPFRFEARPGETNWRAIYQTASVKDIPAEQLTIIHTPGKPNEYLYAKATKPGESPGEPVLLTDDKAAIPLANSDFWLTDLGLEFAHWPSQRYLEGKMRASRYCYVLDSTNPNPGTSGYSHVKSWIDQESGGVYLAEAYDRSGKILKDFSIKSLKKIEGQYQLQEMEIENVQTGSRTVLQFDYEKKP